MKELDDYFCSGVNMRKIISVFLALMIASVGIVAHTGNVSAIPASEMVTVSTDKTYYSPSESMEVKITNVGNEILYGFDPAIGEEIHHLYWQAYDETGEEVGVPEAPAPGFFLKPNDSHVWHWCSSPAKLGQYTIKVFYDGDIIGSTYFFVVEETPIKEILDNPDIYDGKNVVIKGTYHGWKGEEWEGEPPITTCDWAITDSTGEIYVTGVYPHLDPINQPVGLIVIGVVKLKGSIPYIAGKRIEHELYELIGVEPGEIFQIRLTFGPFTPHPSPDQSYELISIQTLVHCASDYQNKNVAVVGRCVGLMTTRLTGPGFLLEGSDNVEIHVLGGIVEEGVWYPSYDNYCETNGVRIGDMVYVYGTAGSYFWMPIAILDPDYVIVCPPNTTYDWVLKSYDPAYIEPVAKTKIGEELNAFHFMPLKEGNTEVVFAFCKLDSNGKTIEEIEIISYEIVIHEIQTQTLTVNKKFAIIGMNFRISFAEVINPGYGWILKSYDPEYVEFIGVDYKMVSN